MKRKTLSKLLVGLLAFGGVFAMASCESTNKADASIPATQTKVEVTETSSGGDKQKFASVYLVIYNNTIYDIKGEMFTYDICDKTGAPIEDLSDIQERTYGYIRHGVNGAVAYTVKFDKTNPTVLLHFDEIGSVHIKDITITEFANVWDTYIAAWIVGICIVGFSVIFFAFDIFRAGWTKDALEARMKEKIASTIVFLLIFLIICMIPLMFASWVPTLILLGAFAGSIVLCGIMTGIKKLTVK